MTTGKHAENSPTVTETGAGVKYKSRASINLKVTKKMAATVGHATEFPNVMATTDRRVSSWRQEKICTIIGTICRCYNFDDSVGEVMILYEFRHKE